MGRGDDRGDRKRKRSRSRSPSEGRERRSHRDSDRRHRRRSPSPEERGRGRSRSRSQEHKRRRDHGDSRRATNSDHSTESGAIRSKDAATYSKLSKDVAVVPAIVSTEANQEEELRRRREKLKAWQAKKAAIEEESGAEVTGAAEDSAPVSSESTVAVAGLVASKADEHKSTLLSSHRHAKPSRFSDIVEEQPPALAPMEAISAAADEDEDPLDAFMSSLYGSGEVASQRDLKSSALPSELVKPQHPHVPTVQSSGTTAAASSSSAVGSAGNDDDDDEIRQMEESIDLHGSHAYQHHHSHQPQSKIITLDEILQQQQLVHQVSIGSTSSASGLLQSPTSTGRQGWESDTGDQSPPALPMGRGAAEAAESEEQREAREEQEHREFVEAIRRARAEEERALQRLSQLEADGPAAAPAPVSATEGRREERLGRVFAEDLEAVDLLDEHAAAQEKRSALELLEEARRGKLLKAVDHNAVQYLPFRKNLYVVPRVLAKLSAEEVQARRDALQIKVRGLNCPPPVQSWEQCGLSDRLLGALAAQGCAAPFAIQQQAIPAVLCGRDVIGVAKTGSGKTLAFVLPMLRHIADQPPLREGDGPIGLIFAPARELAFQIYNQARRLAKPLGFRVACVYGGAGFAEQIADLKRLSEVVVCTPGRMIDLLNMQAGKLLTLTRVTMCVLDEADRMFDMGFEPQIRMILQNTRPDRQTVLFSATFPKAIEKLARGMLRFPLEIIVGERSTVNKDILQFVELHEDDDKFLRLLQLLGIWYEAGSVLVFVDKQEKCDSLFAELWKLGYPCLSLHGGKDQVDRDHAIHEFKAGAKTLMIATSVAGRGLDVPEVVCVVNYHCPNHLEDYVHRVGRTGRAGRSGVAYTFISPATEEQFAPILVKALLKAGYKPQTDEDPQTQQVVPQPLLELAAAFSAKVARGEAQFSGSNGFAGTKGFSFDRQEMNEAQKMRALQQRQYAAEQGLDADPEDLDADDADDPDSGPLLLTSSSSASAAASALPSAAASSSSSSGGVDANAALARARLIAQQLLQQRAAVSSSAEGDAEEGTAAVPAPAAFFSEELEINDYPAQARRKVTQRQHLDDVSERTGVAIISRGSFVAPGKQAAPGERPLYLCIEGASELSVRQARMELSRALEDETLKLASSGSASMLSAGAMGRYSVI